ncbi:phosphotriesterase [Cryptosporangium sp. NPDC048952]|uniref:phosphotriesterase family protein n=1 Tax=Cryptosporangium sp. NPDC048952 TaxID=3363961 RepID=UPI003714072A
MFFRSALLPGDELDDVDAATAELDAFRALGGGAVVQWTPYGLGRRVDDLVTASRATGVHVVAATGLHRAAHYSGETPDDLEELFVRELTVGIHDTGVRAGLVKVAGGYHRIDEHSRRTMVAAAAAHRATGAPIAVHHEAGSAAPDVVDLLSGEGVPPERIVLGHLNRFPDATMHRELARSGAFLAFDGPSRANAATDGHLFDCLVSLVDAGSVDQLLIGGDTTTARARSTAEGPGMPYLLGTLVPRLTREFGADVAHAITVANPARAFARP